jgi:CheY-like chemotaxis protein
MQEHALANAQPAPSRRLLVVEDEPVLRGLFAEVLSTEGHVDVAANGLEALGRLEVYRYDLILTEVAMPRLDGIDLFGEVVAARPELADTFLFLSGGLSEERARFFESEGLWPLLRKPISADELVSVVRQRLAGGPQQAADRRGRAES